MKSNTIQILDETLKLKLFCSQSLPKICQTKTEIIIIIKLCKHIEN